MGNLFSRIKETRRSVAGKLATTSTHKMSSNWAKSETLKFSHYPRAQQDFEPPLIAHDNHFLGDVFSSTDVSTPISSGFYHLRPGMPLEYTYTYHEMKIILDGEVRIRDSSGQEVLATAGDVFYFPKGAIITFSTETPSGVKAFYVGQRDRGAA